MRLALALLALAATLACVQASPQGGVPVAILRHARLWGGVAAAVVVVTCVVASCFTCRRGVMSQRGVVVNYWMGCSIFVVAFGAGPAIVFVVGLTLLETHLVASLAMCGAGLVLLAVGVGLSGHRTLELRPEEQCVVLTRRYFLVIPSTQTYPFSQVSGFTMRVTMKRHRVLYQLQMLLQSQEVIEIEPGFSNVNTRKRQVTCSQLNQFLLSNRDTHSDNALAHMAPPELLPTADMSQADFESVGGRSVNSRPSFALGGDTGYGAASVGGDSDAGFAIYRSSSSHAVAQPPPGLAQAAASGSDTLLPVTASDRSEATRPLRSSRMPP